MHMEPNNINNEKKVSLSQLLSVPQLQHIPLTLSLHGLLGVLLGEGEADRLRRLLTLSHMQLPSLAP